MCGFNLEIHTHANTHTHTPSSDLSSTIAANGAEYKWIKTNKRTLHLISCALRSSFYFSNDLCSFRLIIVKTLPY